MQHAYRPEPGLWFSKATAESILTFQQGGAKLLSVFRSGETESKVLKWLRTFKVLVRLFSIAWNLWKTQLDVLRRLPFQTCSIITILMHRAVCWCISHEQWEDRRSQELSEPEGHDVCCGRYGTAGSLCLKPASWILLQFNKRDANMYVFHLSSALLLEL